MLTLCEFVFCKKTLDKKAEMWYHNTRKNLHKMEKIMKKSDVNLRVFDVLLRLFDEKYRVFACSILPVCGKNEIMGVRVPDLRRIASELISSGECDIYLSSLPHLCYEEDYIHALIISMKYKNERNVDECLREIERFLPYVENWGVCDAIRPKCFKTQAAKAKLKEKICEWLLSGKEYTVRFGMEMTMLHFLQDESREELVEKCIKADTGEYYVQMMLAWLIATDLSYNYEEALKILKCNFLSQFVHNKSINKAIESRKIGENEKAYLKNLRK